MFGGFAVTIPLEYIKRKLARDSSFFIAQKEPTKLNWRKSKTFLLTQLQNNVNINGITLIKKYILYK
ncbi:MAG: hypothetical protein HFJ55_00765 [Clostridia bacterium]|nr:hypothetical protein [Clostridia bacterium]